MADLKFPIVVHHPKTGGVTAANSPGSLKVLEASGWKRRKPPKPDPEPDPAPDVDPPAPEAA